VDVVFRMCWDVVVNDYVYVGDVETTAPKA